MVAAAPRIDQLVGALDGTHQTRIEEVMLTEAITELVKGELGVSVIARWAVTPLVASGVLVARRFPRAASVGGGAAMPKDLAKTDYVRELTDLLVRDAAAEPAQACRA